MFRRVCWKVLLMTHFSHDFCWREGLPSHPPPADRRLRRWLSATTLAKRSLCP